MLSEDELFKRHASRIQEQSGKLLQSAEMRKDIKQITGLLRQHGESVSTPGLQQIRVAVQRELNAESIAFPKGKVYSSSNYDSFRLDDSNDQVPKELSIELDELAIEYVSRIYTVTTEQEQGKIMKKLEGMIDGPQNVSSEALILTITPEAAGKTFDIDSVVFVVVQATGGENYCYQVVPNDRKGKVIPESGWEDELGTIREKIGYIDTYSLKAIEVSSIDRVHIATELHKASELLEKNKPKTETKKEKMRRQIGTLGASVTTKLKLAPATKSSK